MMQSLCSRLMRLAILTSLPLGIGTPLTVHAQAAQGPEPHTEAAVIADDDSWSKAEANGDVAYVDHLLMPEYRSVNADGSVHTKDAILGGVRKVASSPEAAAARAAATAKWRASHRHVTTSVISGDMAILTFLVADVDGPSKPVSSCDIFVYQDGHWRAIYSQHSEAGQ